MANSLLDKLKKVGTIETTAILSKSIYFNSKEVIKTNLPILNIAFSGSLEGGLTSGVTVLAGASKSFKSMLSLYALKAYMDKYEDSVCLFYDSEFGIPINYMKTMGIDLDRIIHIPVTNIEELKFDIVKKLDEIGEGDKVFIMVDSIGNLASKREYENAMNENSAADMTRAKEIKSFFRIITPHISMKDIPCVAIAHTYKEQGLFPKDVVSGGCLFGDMKVITVDGAKEIKDIRNGDKVLTMDGTYQDVLYHWDESNLEEPTPECYEIELEDGSIIRCSDKHKFIIDGVWTESKNIKVGDDLQTL